MRRLASLLLDYLLNSYALAIQAAQIRVPPPLQLPSGLLLLLLSHFSRI